MRVLLVEDDSLLAAALERGFEEEGLGVDTVRDGEEALAAARTTDFDVVVLDVMLPGSWDGFGVCTELRRQGLQVPVLMLTGRDAVSDRVHGLEAGADDYLVKPFAFQELLARIRALVRRHIGRRTAVLEVGGVRLDTAARSVTAQGSPVSLTNKEFAILEYLIHHSGRLLSREQLEEHVWDYDYPGESNLVEVYIARIRRKLGEVGVHDVITTVRGAGYRFEAD